MNGARVSARTGRPRRRRVATLARPRRRAVGAHRDLRRLHRSGCGRGRLARRLGRRSAICRRFLPPTWCGGARRYARAPRRRGWRHARSPSCRAFQRPPRSASCLALSTFAEAPVIGAAQSFTGQLWSWIPRLAVNAEVAGHVLRATILGVGVWLVLLPVAVYLTSDE